MSNIYNNYDLLSPSTFWITLMYQNLLFVKKLFWRENSNTLNSPPFYLSRHDPSHENTFWHILPMDNRKIMFLTFFFFIVIYEHFIKNVFRRSLTFLKRTQIFEFSRLIYLNILDDFQTLKNFQNFCSFRLPYLLS